MDPTLYNAAMEGKITGDGGDFILADHLKRDEENGYQVTPLGNTVLHVAALYGHSDFVGEVLKITPSMLCHQNKKKETALHIAAYAGNIRVVRMLLGAKDQRSKETLMRMTDDNGDTALHKAVRSRYLYVVIELVKEDPEFEFPANKAGETPLYLAAESGLVKCLDKILKYCKTPTYDGPCHRTPLHAAIIQQCTECTRSLWEWNKSLCEEPDLWGWTPLHYAVKLGLAEVVSDMLRWKKSLAYLPAGGENDWTTAIHIAASEGGENMINELTKHCPDCWEMLNSSGQNVLHVAISNKQVKVVKSLLNSKKYHNLIDVPDNDGNTPLHFFAASWSHVPKELLNRSSKVKKMLFNKENQTPLDIALSGSKKTKKKLVYFRRIGRFGRRDSGIKHRRETSDDQDKAKRDATKIEKFMQAAQIHLVVATLIMTVTFTAGFTVPGGFDSEAGPNKGMAILIRKAAFRAFVVSNAIAFTCSGGAIFIYFLMADYSVETKRQFRIVRQYYLAASTLQILAMSAVVIAFITGVYATLARSLGLAITVCAIGCISFVIHWRYIFRQRPTEEVV